MSALTGHGVKMVLPLGEVLSVCNLGLYMSSSICSHGFRFTSTTVLKALEEVQWRTRVHSIGLLGMTRKN